MNKAILLTFCLLIATQTPLFGQVVSIEGGLGFGSLPEGSSTLRLKIVLSTGGFYHVNRNLSVGLEVNYGEALFALSGDFLDETSITIEPESMLLATIMAKPRYSFGERGANESLFLGLGVGVSRYFHYVHTNGQSKAIQTNFALMPELGFTIGNTVLSVRYLTRGPTAEFRGNDNGTDVILNSHEFSLISFVVMHRFSFGKRRQ